MAFSRILDYTGNIVYSSEPIQRVITNWIHWSRVYPTPTHIVYSRSHFYCTIVTNRHVSVSGEKFSVIWVVWFKEHFMRKNWCLCRGNSSGKGFLVINDSFIWEIQLTIRIPHIIWIWGQSQINWIVKKYLLYS